MRHSRVWAIFAVITALFAAGCGGGGGGGSSSVTSVTGRWQGAVTVNGVNGTSSTLQANFLQSGTTITGTAGITVGGIALNGTVTGTISGNQVTATITIPVSSTAQRTDKQSGYNTASFYNTTAPIDLSKPLVVSVGGAVLSPSQYTVSTSLSTLYAAQIYIPAAVPSSVMVQIQYYPYVPPPNLGSTTNLTGTVNGRSITGTSTSMVASSTSGAQAGTFVLTRFPQDPP